MLAEAHAAHGRIDVVVSNAGLGVFGAAEDLSDEQVETVLATNLTASIQLARRVVPYLRSQGGGTLVQMSSMGAHVTFPGFAIYHATKWGVEGYLEAMAAEIAPFGIRTMFVGGTNHFASSGRPANQDVVDIYEELYPHLLEDVTEHLAALAPPGADVSMVATEIARVVALPHGTRPFRTFVDPADDGAEEVSAVADRIRAEFQERIGLADTLTVRRGRSA